MSEENQSHTAEFLDGATAPEGMTTFWYIRHGDTEKNLGDGTTTDVVEKYIGGVKHWYTQGGGNNNALSALGRMQARGLAPLVVIQPITNIRCSPLGRAVETATLARLDTNYYIPTQFDDNLMECNYGRWEGDYAPLSVFIGEDPDTQNSGEFSRNVMKALEACRKPGQLLVAHGNVLRAITGALGIQLRRADCANAQLLRFDYTGDHWTITNVSATQ
jgi:broad specificity phosphatase PhoE